MLLFSYIFAAALELVMVMQNLQTGNLSFAWSFGFLLFLSTVSIPIETSKIGKMVRAEFKSLGINTAKYDFISNASRTITYLFIIIGLFSHITGLIIAYTTTFIILVLAIWKYVQVEKQNQDKK